MIFLDSSFLIAYYNPSDEHKERAIKIMDDLIKGKYGSPIVSDYVFDEVVTLFFTRFKNKSLAISVGEILKGALEIININGELFEESWEIFKNQKNTNFSFTDCTILAVMQDCGISRIATFDEDFLKVKNIKVVS